MRSRQTVLVATVVTIALVTLSWYRPITDLRVLKPALCEPTEVLTAPVDSRPGADPKPKDAPRTAHPIWQLISAAEHELDEVKARQSRTLHDAVAEYRRRYKMHPPPHFDKWFALAKSRGVQLVDEFDTIFELMTPFWGLKPATIRARAHEALRSNNNLMGVHIRRGNVTRMNHGKQWLQEAVSGMMQPFVEHLPDMDLAFNIHDEPRVVLPHDDMSRLVKTAKGVNMAAANAVARPRNSFTKEPKGLDDGARLGETTLTKFNVFSHQSTWSHSRLSCPPDSPARILEEDERVDDRSKFALGELGFIYNQTAQSDICLSPSLSDTYGFFVLANSFNVEQDLVPIFSQSKISSYADIIFPAPWYWYGKVPYDETKDMEWVEKEDQLYWRGSTTGGFSRDGAWRRQHRQRLVQKINAGNQAKIMVNHGHEAGAQDWQAREVPRGDYKAVMDVHFSHVGQCEVGDCDAQQEFFTIKDRADQQDAWRYKYLLDVDGNAFSGRFYAFLQSRSLVYKYSIFREWHQEWLKPWAHYIPLSLEGDDWLEAVRFFGDGTLGRKEGERLAMQSRDWANKVVRKEDMEVWFFRLLLEYGRVIDDDRETIGFAL